MTDYLSALLIHLREHPLPPGVHHVEVQHDDGCGIFRGQSCDCSPTIETGTRVELKYGTDTTGGL